MKYLKSLLIITISLAFTATISSCQKYDDSALVDQIADLTRRVVKLEDLCSNLNTTINRDQLPSRYALFNRLMTLSGESTSWDKFVAYDKINLSSSTNAHDGYSAHGIFVPLAPPVIVDADFVFSSVQNHDASPIVTGDSGEGR